MNYIVFDLEWNQPHTKEQRIKEPVTLNGEIIQIGAVKLNDSLSICESFDTIVRPIYYTQMNTKVKRLTGISQDDIERGESFVSAYRRFLEFCGEEFCFLTWGGDDIGILISNMAIHKIPTNPFPNTYNLQRIYGRQILKTKKQMSLESAVQTLGEPPYRAHNALSDAISTALVCKHLDIKSERATVVSASKKTNLKKK